MTPWDWSGFWQMGGYAAYVWSAVAGALLLMAAEMGILCTRDRDNAARGPESGAARGWLE
jgi:heme exporter protein CcmD